MVHRKRCEIMPIEDLQAIMREADRSKRPGHYVGGGAMSPFDDYPDQARILLGPRLDGNSRSEYGLWLMQNAKQTACAYCGLSFVKCFEHWLLINVDHVIPTEAGRKLGQWARALLITSFCARLVRSRSALSCW
jgi:hypothetical protein